MMMMMTTKIPPNFSRCVNYENCCKEHVSVPEVDNVIVSVLMLHIFASCEDDEQNDSLQKYANNTGNVRINVTPRRVRVTTVPVGKQ
jgi:hypothetical protein